MIHVSIQSDTASFRLISVRLALKRTNPPQNWFQCVSDQKEGVINPAKGQSFSGSSFITRRSEDSQSAIKHIIVLETPEHTVNILAWKKRNEIGEETIFTQKFLANFTNNYKETVTY